MTRSPAENQQTVKALTRKINRAIVKLSAFEQDASTAPWLSPEARAALHDLAVQASQAEDWKQLATEMGEALRNARHGGPKSEYIKVDAADANALLARLDGLAAGEQGA